MEYTDLAAHGISLSFEIHFNSFYENLFEIISSENTSAFG